MHDHEEAIELNIPNDWIGLTRPHDIYRWLEHQVISIAKSEFLENIGQNFQQFVSQKQAKWLRDIQARVHVFELQHSLHVPDRDDFDRWVNEATKALNPNPDIKPSLGTNLGEWRKQRGK